MPITATGITGAPDSSASLPDPALRPGERALADPGPLGEDHDGAAALDREPGGLDRGLVRLAAADREGAEAAEDPALPALLEQLDLGDELNRAAPGQERADHEGVEKAPVVGGDDEPALDARVLATLAIEAKPDEEERQEEQRTTV